MHKIKANIFLEARREWHSPTAGQRGEVEVAEGGGGQGGSVLPAAAVAAAAADRLAALAENENCA